MEIFDTRLKYFSDDNKGTVLAYKTYDYMELMGDKADSKVIYQWLGEAINEMKSDMEPKDAYSYYMVASLTQFLNDPGKKDQYITDYFTVTGYVDEAISRQMPQTTRQMPIIWVWLRRNCENLSAVALAIARH